MKWHYNEPQDLTELTHLVEDWKCYLNYHQFNYLKMTYLHEDSQEEDTWEEEDSQEEESQEEVEDTLKEAEALWQDLLEEDGDPHQFNNCNHKQENW